MTETRIGVGVIGVGFIGGVHIDAIRRLGYADIVAVSHSSAAAASQKASEYGIPKSCATYDELIQDPAIQVVHNCTPNDAHFEINQAAIQAGKHIFSEKPLAMDSVQSAALLEQAEAADIVHGVNFNYRMYPLVQDMRARISAGELGTVRLVHGSYLQDWLLYETDYNWRVDPERGGKTRAVGDIGSHWCDLAQSVTGLRIQEVFAEFSTVHPVRKRSTGATTFSNATTADDWEEKHVQTEDWAGVIVRFENGVRGIFSVSEVSAGRKCRLDLEVDGSDKSFYWNQESGDRLWMGSRDEGNREYIRDPNTIADTARPFTVAPAGHPEGWLDDNAASIKAFYEFIRSGKSLKEASAPFATFRDGHQIMQVVDAIAESAATGTWITVGQ